MSDKNTLMVMLPVLALLMAIPVAAASKGSVTLSLDRTAYVDGKVIKPGECRISWNSHSPDADVTIWNNGNRIEVHGRLVEREPAASHDELVLRKDDQGRQVITEVRLHGKKTVLVIE